MKKILFIYPALALCSIIFNGCLKGHDNDYYSDWRKQNDEWIANLESEVAAGRSEYTKFSADWAPQNSVFVKWHNDRALTQKNLTPLSTSTVDITYSMENIEGKNLGDSFSVTTYGDSIYRSQPNQNIAGMWIAMLNMHVGDSVTMVIPYLSGYGAKAQGGILPYSTLIYHVKMKNVLRYEK
ncbi:MAG: FKBP-type peptidyl-prolyl cis-trans isomerase [Muribaculaceae bacterium]|nr:FKBP-type peptidyl-prolyl cis-trans isomerase [Muribaculaceae bacterium]